MADEVPNTDPQGVTTPVAPKLDAPAAQGLAEFTVISPEGASVKINLPPDTPDAEVRRLAQQQHEADDSVGMDMLKAVPRGLTKGAIGTAGMPGDIHSAMSAAVPSKLARTALFPVPELLFGQAPTSEQIRTTLEKITGSIGKSTSTPGKYIESVFEAAPSAALGPGGPLMKGAQALAGGIFGEGGAEFAHYLGLPETVGRIPGQIAGTVGAGIATTQKQARHAFDAAFDAFQRLGLTPTAATTGLGGKTAQILESNVLPQAVGSAGRIHNVMEGNYLGFMNKQQEIAHAYGGVKPKYDTGLDLQKTILEGWQGRLEEGGKILSAIGKAFGPNDFFEPKNLQKALAKPVGSASSSPVREMTDAPEIKQVTDLLKDKMGGLLTYEDMKALKSKFGDMLNPAHAKPPNEAQINQLVGALDKDIEEAVKSLGNPAVMKDWQYAKAVYKDAMDDYRKAFKNLLGTKELPVHAERVYDILVGEAGIKNPADIAAFETVWRQLGKQKQGELAGTVLAHMGNKDPSKLGDLEGFSLSTFLTNYKNLSPQAKNMLFKQTGTAETQQAFDDLTLAAEKMGVWPALASTSRSGTFVGQMAQVITPLGLAAAGDFTSAIKAALFDIGGPAMAAQILTRPALVKGLARALDTMDTNLISTMKALMAAEGRLSSDSFESLRSGSDKRSALEPGQQFAMADPQFQPGREEPAAATPNEVVQQGFGTVNKDNRQRGMDINRLWNETEENRYFSPSKFPTIESGTRTRRGTVISDVDERPIAGQQYAMADEETRRGGAGFGLGVRGGSGGGGGAPPKEDIAVRGQGGEITTRGGYKHDDLGVRAGKLRSDVRFDPANEDAMRGARVGEDALARFADATQQGMPRAQMIQHPDLWRTASQYSRATGMSLTESFRSLVAAATGYPLSPAEIKLISELAMKTGVR